jgi:hypothetical protein
MDLRAGSDLVVLTALRPAWVAAGAPMSCGFDGALVGAVGTARDSDPTLAVGAAGCAGALEPVLAVGIEAGTGALGLVLAVGPDSLETVLAVGAT